MIRVLVSACLLGEKVRYNGAAASANDAVLTRWLAEGRVVSFCPEIAGGLGVPRPPAEIRGGDGDAVLASIVPVVTRDHGDVTAAFVRGAELALAAARSQQASVAILKDGSPSCGSSWIYDGTFAGVRRQGRGVTAALLERHGIRVFSERELRAADEYLKIIERDVNWPGAT
jgi:uncharacterized protein YbbK (DUF523 family)